jgi:hypothetical protein
VNLLEFPTFQGSSDLKFWECSVRHRDCGQLLVRKKVPLGTGRRYLVEKYVLLPMALDDLAAVHPSNC